MKLIVFTRPGGGVSRIIPDPKYIEGLMDGGLTEDQALVQIRDKDMPRNGINPESIDAADFPDRTFRNAWSHSPGRVTVDLPKAREIQRDRIEASRGATMQKLLAREALGENVTALKAQVANVNAAAIVNAAKDVEELKNSKPPFLD